MMLREEEVGGIPQDGRTAVCAACGAEFSCGAASASGCWCAGLKLTESALAGLRAEYESCLCRACLEGRAAREGEGGAPS